MKNRVRNWIGVLLFVLGAQSMLAQNYDPKKEEFRGVWVHTVYQAQYATMNKGQMQEYFLRMLDSYQQAGMNAFIFQVRPTADAFYKSSLEPWSRFMTGQQGVAPKEDWDPMAFLIEECHKRGMEFHAWLNPYRVSVSENEVLAEDHLARKYPNWFLKYGKQLYFDPGLPQSRQHICAVVKDIVARYDVDAIHMDDYFYPYPIAGVDFPDGDTFNQIGRQQGFAANQKADWRRNNVNVLIEELKKTIVQEKPWVRFGISPFGIYRNQKNDPNGSETNGLENYGDLYADVQLWAKKGWVDYMVPQLYWELGHKSADYETLIHWWNGQVNKEHLYIGQSVVRTITDRDGKQGHNNQLPRKMELARSSAHVSGNVWWNGYDVLQNVGGIRDSLVRNYQRTIALVPAYTAMYEKRPAELKKLKADWSPEGYCLTWKAKGAKSRLDEVNQFVIYAFAPGEAINLSDATKIVGVTRSNQWFLPYDQGNEKWTYVVTTLNRFNTESSKGKKRALKL